MPTYITALGNAKQPPGSGEASIFHEISEIESRDLVMETISANKFRVDSWLSGN